MKKFLVKRIGYMIVTLVIIITATFYMMHSIPGDPLAHMARNLPEQTKSKLLCKIWTGQIHNGTIWNFYEESDYER